MLEDQLHFPDRPHAFTGVPRRGGRDLIEPPAAGHDAHDDGAQSHRDDDRTDPSRRVALSQFGYVDLGG